MVSVDTLVTLLIVALLVPTLLFGAAAGYAVARLFGLPAQLRVYGDSLGVGRWSAAGATLLAVSVVLTVQFFAGSPGEGDPGSTLANATMALVLAGAFALAFGVGNLRRYLQVRTVTDAIDAAGARATVTVSGTAEAGPDGEVEAPLSGEPCLAWAVRVRERRGLGYRGVRGLRHADHGGVRFEVRDDSGRVHVDPERVELSGWSFPPRSGDYHVAVGDGLPDRVAAYRDEHDLGDGDERVYEELRLVPGTTVTATGRVETVDGVTMLAGTGTLRREPADAVRHSLRRRVLVGAGGAAALAAGTLALALVTGLA